MYRCLRVPVIWQFLLFSEVSFETISVQRNRIRLSSSVQFSCTYANLPYNRLHLEGNSKSEENLPQTHFKLPHVIIIVDELAELMWSEEDIENPICHLAMLAQDAGIHLIIATQLPTCDILTGRIKANIPSRIAFKVSGIEDSITIIDQEGAESLLGMGDMLYCPQGHSKPLRLQGAFVSDDEVNKVVGHLKKVNYSNFFKNPFSDDENIITLRTKTEEIESDIWK